MPTANRSASNTRQAPGDGGWVGSALLLVLLVLIGLRPLVQETHDTDVPSISGVLSPLPSVGPLPTLWFNLAIMVVCGLTVALRAAGSLPRPRRTGLWPGLIVVAFAACTSCFLASNRRLAINATFDWITLPMLAIGLASLLQRRWQIRLSLAVIIASGVASAVNSFDQKWWSFPETVRDYEQRKAELWGPALNDPDAWQIKQFEKRLHEQAASGFFAMTNVAGSYFLLTTFVAFAVAIACRARSLQAVLAMTLTAVMGVAVVLTRSRGAMAALVVGLLFWGVSVVLRHWLATHRWTAWAAAWALTLLGLGCVGAYGLTHGELPGGSLTYRWWYWEATARMVRAGPWVGVGSEQFGRYYPRYKELKSPEEVANPHNFLAQAGAEWGLPGMIGTILMLVGGSMSVAGLHVAQPRRPVADRELIRMDEVQGGGRLRVVGCGLAVGAVIWSVRLAVVGSSDLDYVLASNAYPLFGWAIAFAVVMACQQAAGRAQASAGSGSGMSAGALGGGLFGFLVYELINHALFTPGSGTTFFAVLGICVAMRDFAVEDSSAMPAVRRRRAAAGVAGLVTLGVGAAAYVLLVLPVERCWEHLTAARLDPEFTSYELAWKADGLDPTPAREFCAVVLAGSEALASSGNQMEATRLLEQALPAADEAIRRDPESLGVYRLKAAVLVALAGHTGRSELLHGAVAAYDQVLQRYPTNPDDWVRMSDIHVLLFDEPPGTTYAARAADYLQKALELDAMRPVEEVRRFSTEKRKVLEARLTGLRVEQERSTQEPEQSIESSSLRPADSAIDPARLGQSAGQPDPGGIP